MIRDILQAGGGDRRYVLVVEHDLAVLDYLSDFVCVLYGQPGGYGVVTMPHSVRAGINAFLAGFITSENMRFRDYALTFRVSFPYAMELSRAQREVKFNRSRREPKVAMTKRTQ